MTEPRWLTPEELRAWTRLMAVVELIPSTLDSQLQRDAGLTHFEYMVLDILSKSPDRKLRMTELAHSTNSTLPRLSHVVTRLQSRSYVTRMPCPGDKRATNCVLTDVGRDKIVASAPGHVETVVNSILAPLDERDLADLERVADRILGTLDPQKKFSSEATGA